MKSKLSTTVFWHVVLTVITLMFLFLPLEAGMFFGSEGDWYSQHVGIAESLRQTMLETHCLIPQYIHLGGGSSIYDFSYYGLVRPDILFSCLVPGIGMKYIIAGYAVLGVVSSVNLCYIWLKNQGIAGKFAFAGAFFFASASCFYQAHHQIMFVNYMPFLFLALMGVDRLLKRNRMELLTVALFCIYIHSFYYAPSCLLVIGIYAVHQLFQMAGTRESLRRDELKTERLKTAGESTRQIVRMIGVQAGRFVLSIVVSIGMAMVLLLPTGLTILSGEKDGGSFAGISVKVADWSLKGLLYTPYGCGMTLIVLYCLLLSITKRRKRFLSVTLTLCILLPGVSFLLNGFLYARAKILIPFVSLLVLVVSDTLQELYQGKQKYCLIPLFLCFIPLMCSVWKPVILLDGFVLVIWLLSQRICKIPQVVKRHTFWLVLLAPALVSLGVNMSDSYLRPICSRMGIPVNGAYLETEDDRQSHFTSEEIREFVEDSRYRFDVLANNFVNCNLLADGGIHKTAMYSSVTNTGYAKFCYNTMKNPISVNNRVALLPDQNRFFDYFMGVKYVLAEEGNVPCGYGTVAKKGNYILAKNDDVLPVCYGTSGLIDEGDYKKLKFPDTLEALCSRAVVPEGEKSDSYSADDDGAIFTSHIKEENAADFFVGDGGEKLLNPSGGKENYALPLVRPLDGKILILSFHVESKDGKEVIIRINGMRNKLSAKSAPYPNNNHDFTYVLAGEDLQELEIEVSAGNYTVENLKIYTVDWEKVKHPDIAVPKEKVRAASNGKSVFQGEITMEEAGYFITSYPYRQGYHIKVDGEAVEAQRVNTAFVGFPVSAGGHQIEITYEAPGFQTGSMISIISFVLFGLLAAGPLITKQSNCIEP